ncbi:MAG TPA: hypothetical protein VK886_07460 [Vicinamibacterales bacterium]|nr:hypothetical protein [Vicinamibacterales bacterium]
MRTRYLAVLLVLAATPACAAAGDGSKAAPVPQAPAVNPDAQVQKAFADRVQQYLELRKKEGAQLPRLSDESNPAQITAHQKSLLKRLQEARRGVPRGEIFDEDIERVIRQLLANALAREGSAPRQAIRDEDPGQIPVSVNGAYPTTAPLPTVPPQALLALPRLPGEELEYRFLGRRLILLDTRANMIVDYMDNALP